MSIEEINPRVCQMWHMHERLGEYVDTSTCASLIDSIQQYGQKQPALGRRIVRVGSVEVELIYGARRLFAAQHLRRKLIVDIRDIDDRTALIEMDIENRVRTDISPYERGLSYRRWLSRGHFKNQAEIARALGVSEAQISRLMKYAELPAAVVEAFGCPRDIREEWAVALAKKCQDSECRASVLRRARRTAQSGRLHTPQAIYDALVREGLQSPEGIRPHDEIVRDLSGKPLLRIGYRSKTVHLILSRESTTPELLEEISEQIRGVLQRSRLRSRGSQGKAEPQEVEITVDDSVGRVFVMQETANADERVQPASLLPREADSPNGIPI